ncbi:cob(II)yrinic acid a,c-diamide reductase [Cognatiyoonia koreensis]|uniref:Cob(II)yrinic acid a,c-diamide reductase n=1 Tax=Cognatiyoonia koreensis TaxID=364200 RepID=A0A1I0RDG4_9RHOB|nr:5,6-dimethylbenzimidazole synthase [Cognatiyoonia koreensis]SEW38628.1 cob(II)yrinic acid a,c-diamide reductase [Cognatiyoonia koreensis]
MKLTQPHRDALADILQWRRDVRHFRPDQLPDRIRDTLQKSMDFAPSVGNARPWRVIEVASQNARKAIIANFESANADAADIYTPDRRENYVALKLAGLQEAPLQLAVFTDLAVEAGHGLGRQSMPEMLQYSTVTAIHTLWLTARAENIGVGWVSILDPAVVCDVLAVPDTWMLTGYLCIGYAAEEDDTPLLDRNGWQANSATRWERR